MLAADVLLKGSEVVGEFGVGVLVANFLLKGSEVVGKEAKGAAVDDPNEDDVNCDDVTNADIVDVDVKDFEAKDDVPDGLLLVVSLLDRKTPFFLSQQVCAKVPFPQQ